MNNYFLDCGSNLGQGVDHFSQIYKFEDYNYILFEPNVRCFNFLNEKYIDNKKIKIQNRAVWIENKKIKFYYDTPYSVGGSIIDNHNSAYEIKKIEEEVDSVDINELIDSLYPNEIILKLDVESSEYEILKSMINKKTIFKVKKIYCEFHSQYMRTPEKENHRKLELEFLDFMKKNNIEFVEWH